MVGEIERERESYVFGRSREEANLLRVRERECQLTLPRPYFNERIVA